MMVSEFRGNLTEAREMNEFALAIGHVLDKAAELYGNGDRSSVRLTCNSDGIIQIYVDDELAGMMEDAKKAILISQ